MTKFKKTMAMSCAAIMTISAIGMSAFAYGDISTGAIREKQLAFAARYSYKEGDFDKSFNSYPGILYTSGIEYRADGTVYECPAIYVDEHAMYVNDYSLQKGEAKFIVNGMVSQYFDKCVLYNSRLLVPVDSFAEVGCEVTTDADTYVTTISKDGVVLEILPNLIGMRKNRAEGFYVPIEVCARIIDDTLYVPVRAVADEFGLKVSWDGASATVTLNQ